MSSTLKTIRVTLSTAEVLLLNTTPTELIPAPGASKFIMIIGRPTCELDYNSIAYVAANVLNIGYDTATAEAYYVGATFVNGAADNHTYARLNTSGATASIVANKALVARSTSDPTTGNSPLIITINYMIVDEV